MSDFPTKAHGKRRAGGENTAPHLKPSDISKKTKIDSSEKIFSTEEDVSPVNSEKIIIDLTVEHSASPFTSSLVSELSVHVTKDEQDNKWLDNIRVECSHKDGWVGRAVSSYIHRQGIKSNFLNMMELPSYKMGEMAGELFNKFGCLLRKFEEHVVQRGTGAWGAEMDVGPLVLLEEIEITDKGFRRKGLGRAMIKALIQESQAQAHPFRRLLVIARPDWIIDNSFEEAYKRSDRERRATKRQALDSAIAFYRSLGFRRIGSSSYFGFSVDPKHKAHSINVDADYDPPRVDEELEIFDDEDIVDTSSMHSLDEAAKKRLAKLKQRLPLQHAIQTLSDAELVAFFKNFDNKNGSGWKEIDSHHNNVLHQTGCAYKVYATKWLIKNIDPEQELAQARNIEGLTPLEALQDEFDIFDELVGLPFGAIACLSLLKYRYLPSSPLNTQALRLKVHNLKTLSATYNGVDDDDLKAALAMTIAYAKENFLENLLLERVQEKLVAGNMGAEETLGAELRASLDK
ncbi:hypothetical protein BGAL_0401g00050 [Botrytis galanthina]|uniref:Uncharacterized protein n=1 Tax=Botrytis galanthina TaxID=278940 RepID=A0A4S8QNK7_9HELO|nr:hypothetical protein BGAL_0401g00050 [Botrytis galanthina]